MNLDLQTISTTNNIQFMRPFKIISLYSLAVLLLTITSFTSFAQRVGIGTSTPDSSAILEVKSSNTGFLPPRMTSVQKNSIRRPAEGLVIYQTDSIKGIWIFKSGAWKLIEQANGTAPGQMQYWNGNEWLNIPPGSYGKPLVFCDGVPTWGGCLSLVKTGSKSSITYTGATIVNNEILNDGGSAISIRGICYDRNPNPTISSTSVTNPGAGVGTYNSTITGLMPGTTYYYRAFCTNGAGTTYGSDSSFTTSDGNAPQIFTRTISNIAGVSANSGGIVLDSGGLSLIAKGICWSTNPNPTIALSTKTNEGSTSANFTSLLTNLTPNTRYYIRAYATNSFGTGYGGDTSFITRASSPASVRTRGAFSIAATTVKAGGIIIDSGGINILAKGVCWSTSPNPNISLPTKTIENNSLSTYESLLTNLNPNTLYYVRAYVTTNLGTYYGSDSSFITFSVSLPIVQTLSPLSTVSGTAARSGGNIIDSGYAPIFSRGICWGTSPNPILGIANQVFTGTGSGRFFSLFSGLSPNTRYYVRAFATNAAGTAYGSDSSFITPPSTQIVYTQNFDAGLNGWTVTSDSTSPAVCNWQLFNSPYTALVTGVSGFKNFTTTQGGGFIKAFPDKSGAGITTNTTITSPVINLSGIGSPTLSFEQLYRYYNAGNETMFVQISTNGGTSWNDLLILNPASYGSNTSENQSTVKTSVSLAAYAGLSNVSIRFKCISTYGYYWIIDDINIINQ